MKPLTLSYRRFTRSIPSRSCSLTRCNRTRREGLNDRLSQKLHPPVVTAPSTLGQVKPASMLTRWIRPPNFRLSDRPNAFICSPSACQENDSSVAGAFGGLMDLISESGGLGDRVVWLA